MKRSEIPRDNGAVVGCYSVHLYCQHPFHDSDVITYDLPYYGSFAGNDEAGCLKSATEDGWWISRKYAGGKRAVLCPYHAREVSR